MERLFRLVALLRVLDCPAKLIVYAQAFTPSGRRTGDEADERSSRNDTPSSPLTAKAGVAAASFRANLLHREHHIESSFARRGEQARRVFSWIYREFGSGRALPPFPTRPNPTLFPSIFRMRQVTRLATNVTQTRLSKNAVSQQAPKPTEEPNLNLGANSWRRRHWEQRNQNQLEYPTISKRIGKK